MKTKNNVQKATFKSVAAATGLAILSFTVNAQGSMKSLFENDEISNIAMVTGKMSNNSFASTTNTRSLTEADAFATYLVKETEEELKLENWMLDESNFNGIQNNSASNEPKLNNKVFSTSTFFFKDVVIESKLSVEGWMTNSKVWVK